MTTPFSDPIIGGQGALIRPFIKSPDYQPGVAGWAIFRDGSAEFNNGTFRGQLVVVDQAAGVFAELVDGAVTVGSLAGAGSADLIWGSATALAAGSIARLIADDPSGQQSFIDLVAPSGSPGALYVYGFNPSTGQLEAVTAGLAGDLSYVIPGAAPALETWHPLALAAGWSTGPAGLVAQYQRRATREIELIGQITTSVAVSGTVSPFTTVLPAGPPVSYRPAHDQRRQLEQITATGAPAYPQPNIHVASTGAITFESLPAGTTAVQFGCTISLDA